MRRNAMLFVAISLLSGFGSTAMALVAGIWILDLTGSSSVAGLTGLSVYAPVLAAPWLGALVDRLPRRPMLIWVNVVLAAALLLLFAVRSRDQVWLIFAVMVARGLSYVFLDAGETALLPAALAPDVLGQVNGWRSSAQEGMKLVAPLAGAALYAWHGETPVVILFAAMPLAVAALYAAVRLDRPRRSPAITVAAPNSGVRAGLAVLWQRPGLRTPVLVASVAIAMSGFTTAAQYSVVTDRLGLPLVFLGLLASAQGAGSIAGGLGVGRLLTRLGPVPVAAAGAVLFAVGCLSRCLPWPAALLAGSVLIGVGLPWTLIAGITAVQLGAPDAVLGRVAATSTAVMFGPIALAIPLGSAAVGLGGVPPFLFAAALCLATAAAVMRTGARRPVGVGVGE
jgi:Na+/melibiose symporter-like transporter